MYKPTASAYCHQTIISGTNGATYTNLINGGAAGLPTIASGNRVVQQLMVVYDGAGMVVLTNVSVFKA